MPGMGFSASRPFRLGCFDVRDGLVVAADESLPLAIEVDAGTGQVAQVFSWALSPSLRSRPVALDVVAAEDSIMIASPAAGGIVQLDRRSSRATVIQLDAEPGALTICGDTVWAVAHPDWYLREDDEADVETDVNEAGHVPRGAATPVWHIRAGTARRIDVDLEGPRLAAIEGTIVGACRLPGDPLIRHLGPGGSVDFGYPGTIITLDEAGAVTALGPVPSTHGVICEDGGRVWLLGFNSDIGDPEDPGPRELFLADGRIGAGTTMRLEKPVGLIDGLVADLTERPPAGDPGGPRAGWSTVVRFLPLDGGEPSEVVIPRVGLEARAKVRSGQVWIGDYGDSRLKVVTPGQAHPRELSIALDCRPWMTRPQPPGLDLREFEDSQLDRFRGELSSLRRDGQGRTRPLVEGVSFDAFELRGAFPDSDLVALFRSADRPGVQFGRKRPLYDELGNPLRHRYSDIYLAEDILSGGLPELGQCIPDASGVVWF